MKSLMVNCGAKLKLIEDSNLLISRKQIKSKFWLENTALPSLDSKTVFGYEDEESFTPGRFARKEASLNITIPSVGIDSSFGFSKATREPGSSAGTMAALTVWAWRDPKTPGLNLNFKMTANKRTHYVFALLRYPGKLDHSLTSVVDMKARQHILNITRWSQPILNAETSSYQLQMSVEVGNGLRQLELNQTCITMGTVPSTLYTTNVSMVLMPDRKINGRALLDIRQLPWWIIANPTAGKSNRLTAKLNRDGSRSLRCSLEGEAADSSTMKFKFKADKQETAAGDVSVMLAVVPGQPTETFKGIFYKSTSQYAFTESEHACSHEGEWNGNRGYAPGMPFRFGVQYKHQPDFRQGSINVYAEDTNLGKATDFELAEALYEYSVKGPDGGVRNDGVYQLSSEYMLNWRRYLSRGVAGTQGFLNANLSRDFMQGDLSFSTHLTDFAQSSLEVSMNYVKKEKNLLVTSNAQLEGSPVYIAELTVEESGDNRTVDFFLETTKTAEVKAANLTAPCSSPEDINQACPLTYQPAPRISAKHFLQVSFIDGLRQTQLKSNLLKDPIFIETSKTDESEAVAIYRGLLEDRSDPIAIASYELAYSGPQESKRQLRLEKGGKVYTVSDLRTVGELQVQHGMLPFVRY
ncbi:unnamed protein product [Dibothriocephalus latus]|uniref:Uncharacterized protein n=1 Tax=Dibothriocephalus latus TaxID=60516 RepID=A0A3P6TIL6_DIBLA|nr:unnamed protein product [Dibothriocephalus latus]